MDTVKTLRDYVVMYEYQHWHLNSRHERVYSIDPKEMHIFAENAEQARECFDDWHKLTHPKKHPFHITVHRYNPFREGDESNET